MVGAALFALVATVTSAGAGVPDSSSTIAPPPTDPPSTTSVYQPPSTTAYQPPSTTATYYSLPTTGYYEGSGSATTSPPATTGDETEPSTTTSRPPSTTSPTIAPAGGETEVDVVDGQDVSDTNDTAQRTITYVIAGLIGLALVIGLLTFFYWRMTRPAPMIAADDDEQEAAEDEVVPPDAPPEAVQPVSEAGPFEQVSVAATAETAPVPVTGRNGGDADGGMPPQSEAVVDPAGVEGTFTGPDQSTAPVDEPTQAVETVD